MKPKPAHLGPSYAAQFRDLCVAAAYPARPPYPPETFELLEPRGAGLDLGCGTGDLARHLAPRMERVDAVDFSLPMIERGRALPGGDRPNLRWIHAAAEEAPLDPPYDLVTAGESLHWMDWEQLFPRLTEISAPQGRFVLLLREQAPVPWESGLRRQIARHSTNRDYVPYDLVELLVSRRLGKVLREARTAWTEFRQPVAEYVESFHSRNGFSRLRMGEEDARVFDSEIRALAGGGEVLLSIRARLTWLSLGS